MKYFTKELWNSINADDISVRNDALKEWEKRTEEYLCAFNKVKAKFPKSFLKVYDQNEGFHDYKLESITFKLKRKKYILVLFTNVMSDLKGIGVTYCASTLLLFCGIEIVFSICTNIWFWEALERQSKNKHLTGDCSE